LTVPQECDPQRNRLAHSAALAQREAEAHGLLSRREKIAVQA
jgi:hypothetical protein